VSESGSHAPAVAPVCLLGRRASAPAPPHPLAYLARMPALLVSTRSASPCVCSLPCASRPRARPRPYTHSHRPGPPSVSGSAHADCDLFCIAEGFRIAEVRPVERTPSGTPSHPNRRRHGDRCGLYAASSRHLTSARLGYVRATLLGRFRFFFGALASISLLSGKVGSPASRGAPPGGAGMPFGNAVTVTAVLLRIGAPADVVRAPLRLHLPRGRTASVTG
jgi:hypothetical protein